MKKIIITSLVIICSSTILGRDILLKGYAPGGSGKFIELYNQPDPVTGHSDLIERKQIFDDETFSFKINCDNISWFKLKYSVYEIIIVAREGNSYDLQLPYYKEMTRAEKLNPFFAYKPTYINMTGNDKTNNEIKYIDSLLYSYTNLFTRSTILGKPLVNKDSLLRSFAHIQESLSEEYANIYFEYRHCFLKMILRKQLIPGSYDIALINKRFLPDMPAYTELVSIMFNGYLKRLASDSQSSSLREYINSGGPYDEIVNLVQEDGIIKDTSLLEFVILFNLYNEYYSGGFLKEGLEDIFEWMSEHAVDEYNRNIADFIIEKINRLKPGNKPPVFKLKDQQGKIYTLDSLRGKYTLLAFGSTELPETKYELDILKNWTGEYKDRLAVVMILLDGDFDSSLEQLGAGNYDYTFLDGSGSTNLVGDYEIKYLPSFYFLNSDLRLILSPAILPSENLKGSVILQLSDRFMDDIRN